MDILVDSRSLLFQKGNNEYNQTSILEYFCFSLTFKILIFQMHSHLNILSESPYYVTVTTGGREISLIKINT